MGNEGQVPICTGSHNPASSRTGCSWLSDILSKQFLMVTREPVGNLPAANVRRRDKGILQISLLWQGVCLAVSASTHRHWRTAKFDHDRNLHLGKVVFVATRKYLMSYLRQFTFENRSKNPISLFISLFTRFCKTAKLIKILFKTSIFYR